MVDRVPRILWVHQNFVARGQAGNERPLYTVAAFLERGWAVDLVTGSEGYQGPTVGDRPVGTETEGRLTWHRLAHGGGRSFASRRAGAYVNFLWRVTRLLPHLERPDLVFASTPPLPQISIALAETIWHDVPLVLEVRDLWPAFLVELGLIENPVMQLGLEWLEAASYRSADAVVSVSPAFGPYLQGMGIKPERLLVVPHGAADRNTEQMRVLGECWRRELGLEDAVVLLYAGSLNEHYGVETLLAAARATAGDEKAITWIVAGDGRSRASVVEAARSLENLLYLGPLPRSALDPLLGAADAGIVALSGLPLFSTVLPGKLVDCLSSALPVICTVQGQAARFVSASGAGWTCSDDAQQLAQAARVVADTDPAKRRAMGRQGRDWVRSKMAAESQGRAIADLCDRVLEGPVSHPRRRVLLAMLRALPDVARRTSVGLLDTLYRGGDERPLQRAVDEWLALSPHESKLGEPLKVPRLFR